MQVILDNDESWSLMTLIASRLIDGANLSSEGRTRVKRWRSDRSTGTVELGSAPMRGGDPATNGS